MRECWKPRNAVSWLPDHGQPDRRELLSRRSKRKYTAGHQKGIKLSPEEVVTIRELWAAGVSQQRIAASFGLSQPTICQLVRRKIWATIPASDRERTLLCAHEPDELGTPTTGLLQCRDDQGAWVTIGDIRDVERLSGLEREVIAEMANHDGRILRWEPIDLL